MTFSWQVEESRLPHRAGRGLRDSGRALDHGISILGVNLWGTGWGVPEGPVHGALDLGLIVKATDLADIAWDTLILMFNCLSEIELFLFFKSEKGQSHWA